MKRMKRKRYVPRDRLRMMYGKQNLFEQRKEKLLNKYLESELTIDEYAKELKELKEKMRV